MAPSVGRIVHVKIDASAAAQIGGNAREGDVVPAIITFGNDSYVNVKALGDGPGHAWLTSITEGTGTLQWQWPQRAA